MTSFPDGTCGYWIRVGLREADEEIGDIHGNAPAEVIAAWHQRVEDEDKAAPPCGRCRVCRESEESALEPPPPPKRKRRAATVYEETCSSCSRPRPDCYCNG